jgi:hypothetical protein
MMRFWSAATESPLLKAATAVAVLQILALLFLTATAIAQTTIHNDDSCDIGVTPAATLLLPYFEVDIASPRERALTTLFSITNVTGFPQIARVTLWTDWAYPVLAFNVFLTGYDVQSINLYDVLVDGRIARTSNESPRGGFSVHDGIGNVNFLPTAPENCSPSRMPSALPPAVLDDLRYALAVGTISQCGTARIGNAHTNAIGYATIDLVADCTSTMPSDPRYHASELLYENVLIGDSQVIDPNPVTGNQAAADPLVHIRAVPEGGKAGSLAGTNLPYTFYDRYTPAAHRGVDRRQPLPSAFAARYIQGGPTGFITYFKIWREGTTGADAACSAYVRNSRILVSDPVRFDERENATTMFPPLICTCTYALPTTPSAISIPSPSSSLPPLSSGDVGGWMYFNLHDSSPDRARASQNWVSVEMKAEGRYSVAMPAAYLGNGCSPPAPAPTTRDVRIGPRP